VRINRTQALVLGFSLGALVTLVGLLVAAPGVFDEALRLPGHDRRTELGFLSAISALILVLGVGVVRRWRWMFWLILVAFLAGLLRFPATLLQVAGLLPATGPTWYALLQGAVGLVQFSIALAMLSGFRRSGVWGAFGRSELKPPRRAG